MGHFTGNIFRETTKITTTIKTNRTSLKIRRIYEKNGIKKLALKDGMAVKLSNIVVFE
jgi:hypothetical protein